MTNAKEFVCVHTTYQGDYLSTDIQSIFTLEPAEVSEIFWFKIREKLSEHLNTHVEKAIKDLNVENVIQEADLIIEINYSYDEKQIDYPSEESDLDFCDVLSINVLDEKVYPAIEDAYKSYKIYDDDYPSIEDSNFTPDVG